MLDRLREHTHIHTHTYQCIDVYTYTYIDKIHIGNELCIEIVINVMVNGATKKQNSTINWTTDQPIDSTYNQTKVYCAFVYINEVI